MSINWKSVKVKQDTGAERDFMPRSVFDLIKDKNTILGETSGWPLVPEFLDLLELLVDYFFTCKMLEKGSFGHNALEIFLIIFSYCDGFSRWETHLICHFSYLSSHPSVSLSVVCWLPYVRNHTSSDHNFWYSHVNWYFLQFVLSFFFNFVFFSGC